MSNPSKRKGTDAEVKLLAWLKANGHKDAVRNPPAGAKDVGDLCCSVLTSPGDGVYDPDDAMTWWEPCVIEVKSWKDVAAAMRQGIAELEVEKQNAGTGHGVLVLRRRGVTDPGEWYAVRRVCDDPELGS